MRKVKDIDGTTVRGAFKQENGAIVFNDPVSLRQYQMRKDAATRQLSEVEELRKMVRELAATVQVLQKGQ